MKAVSQHLPLLVACCVPVLLAFVTTGRSAESLTETKIRLMAETLRARDAGELDLAQKGAEQLRGLVPNDISAQRLQRQIEALIAARTEAIKNPPQPPMVAVALPLPEPPRPPRPVVDQSRAMTTTAVPLPASPAELEAEAEALAKAEAARLGSLVTEAAKQKRRAHALAGGGRYDDALAALAAARASLPLNSLTQASVSALDAERHAIERRKDDAAARAAAEAEAVAQKAARKAATAAAKQLAAEARAAKANRGPAAAANAGPALPPAIGEPAEATAVGIEPAEIGRLATKGRSQYLAGDLDGAQETFRDIEARDPDNDEAKRFLLRIAGEKAAVGALNREMTRAQLLEEVTKSWQRPGLYQVRDPSAGSSAATEPLAKKLNDIVLPSVSFTRTEIGQVVAALGAISEEFDHTGGTPKGVNLVLLDPTNKAPTVTITLRHASLKRVLDFVTESIGYQYEVQADAVVVRPGGETSTLDTAFFPVTRATVLRMTGIGGVVSVIATKVDPLSSAGASNDGRLGLTGGEGPAVKAFLQQAGVSFATVSGSSLAYDGSALIVTQTARNLERIRNILNRYNDVRQVEIEAKFIEVQEGALEELGINWTVAQKATQHNGAKATYATDGRSLAGAFSNSATNQRGRIVRPESETVTTDGVSAFSSALDIPIINNAPAIPGTANLAAGAGALATVTGVLGEFDVNAVVRALAQKQGTDLLSAPKITVLSGNPATITVAQEMRYPQSFGQTQSQVGTGSASGGGSAGVAITAGTPQEFTARNVGVELKVTPTVEEDDYSISLDLNPRVTEFDGFVEYGGPSIAISGSTTVTVPSGFYQPIFSVRDISTKVTLWDGATLVMGGLTREEVKKVNDKVPILGDLPLIGRAFRSKGESAQKRNLLIFVTANLVSPGGSPKKQNLRGVPTGTLFRNPAVVTPAGAAPRAADGR